ncbi:hypothetical protein F5878DRAFT_722084 [Lentinula raphanica]|uniref:Uncharacterized protein n=1 Tax=Lentinula raphanica TaxID=153919 RepID=A0AA38UIL7_9AGAR|nr:hypothetical protein F5878DRAFT_722084 [Lentinula raphanica]
MSEDAKHGFLNLKGNHLPPNGRENSMLFSRIRNFNQTFSSIASLFYGTSNDSGMAHQDGIDSNEADSNQQAPVITRATIQNGSAHDPQKLAPPFEIPDVDTPTPTRPGTPCIGIKHEDLWEQRDPGIYTVINAHETSPSDLKSLPQHDANQFNVRGLNCNALEDSDTSFVSIPELVSSIDSLDISSSSFQSSESYAFNRYISIPSMLSSLGDTPPLSPDSSSCGTSSSLSQLAGSQPISRINIAPIHHDNNHDPQGKPKLEEIREGKKPERTICHDPMNDIAQTNSAASDTQPDNASEWYGLEYTLELSCKERHASETYACDNNMGESSRSRESWAALRRGTIHPFFEDEDYHQWKNWHKHLDREEERRRFRRRLEFEARSKDLAWYYLNEMRTREVMYWQLEVYGMIGSNVKERLVTLTERRRDPYYLPKKHNLGWYLKRSRTIACLREFRPQPRLSA